MYTNDNCHRLWKLILHCGQSKVEGIAKEESNENIQGATQIMTLTVMNQVGENVIRFFFVKKKN